MTDQKGAEQTASSLADEALNQARARFLSSESPVTPGPESVKKKPGRKTAAVSTSNTLQDLQKTLWATADKMRANMDAAEYKHIVPGLIFLKCKALVSKSSGLAQQNLNKGLVSNHKTLLAPDSILKSYESVTGVLLDGWIENSQAQRLTQIRDSLLPRLISGQLRLPEAELMVEEICA